MTTKDETIFKVPKLLADGSNWVTYRDRLRWALSARGLLDNITDSIPEPTNPTVNDPPPDPSDTAAIAAHTSLNRGYAIRIEKWATAEATVKQCIASTVPDSIFNRIKAKKSAKDVWDAVTEIFEDRSTMVAIDLRLKLQSIKCGENEDVRTHFSKLAEMNERLASYGVTLTDHEYASILVGSLPSIYDPTLSSILAAAKLSKTALNPDTVISLITDDHDRRAVKRKGRKDEKDEAYYAGEGSNGGKRDRKTSKEGYNCKKKGHLKADCWAKGGGKEGQGPKGKKAGEGKGEKGAGESGGEEREKEGEGVWAVADEDEVFEDWKSDSNETIDWSLLSDENFEEDSIDLPAQHIPDADPADKERLRSILFSCKPDTLQKPDDNDSMPGLKSVSDSESDCEFMPGRATVTDSDYEGSESNLEDSDDEAYPYCSDTTLTGAVITGTAGTRKAESDLYDSGASRHMTPFRHRLIKFTSIKSRPIQAADKRTFHVIGKGDMYIKIPNEGKTTTILLKDVLYAPDMGLTIISISRVAAAGYSTLFRSNFCRIFDAKQCRIGHIHVTPNGLYRVDHEEYALAVSTKEKISLMDLHRRMGHIAPEAVKKLVREGRVEGIALEVEGDMGTCESCEYAKTTRKNIKKERQEPKATHFGDEIHSDVWGPSQVETINHRRYYASFTDDKH